MTAVKRLYCTGTQFRKVQLFILFRYEPFIKQGPELLDCFTVILNIVLKRLKVQL
jgi:hypothetical protein